MTFDDFVVRESVYSPGARQPRHVHEHSNVTVITRGQLEEASESGCYRASASSVVVKGAMAEHEDRISGFGARCLSIQFAPESRFGRCVRPGAWAWFEMAEVVRAGIALQRAFDRGDRSHIESAAAVLVEAVHARDLVRGNWPPWLTSLRTVLDARFDEPIRFEELARDFGLHPVYASRAFRRFTGVSMTEYVRAARLLDARRHLASTRRSIGAIAIQSGFADASHLSRTFSNSLGVTPKQYRLLMQG
jgi:AraC family transcriptional regulator